MCRIVPANAFAERFGIKMAKKIFSDIGRFLKSLGRYIFGFFKKNFWLKLASLFFAIFLWTYVIADENPTRQMSLKNIPVTYTGISELSEQGLTVETDKLIHSVDISILAGQDSHKNINENTVSAFLDFSHINEPGTYTLDVQASITVGGASARSITPANVQVEVEELVERKIPVTCQLEGNAAEGCYVEEPQPEEAYIVISGAKSKIEQVARAVATISVEGLSESTENSYMVELFDLEGKRVEMSSINGQIPSVIVRLNVLRIKTIALDEEEIKRSITDVKEGYEVTNVTLTPAAIEVVGTEEVLAQLESLSIKTVSAENADQGKILIAELQPIEGIQFLSGNSISIYAQISEKTMEKHFENVVISAVNANSNFKITFSVTHTDITVTGGISAMTDITRRDLQVYIDLAGLSSGTYVLPVKVEELAGINSSEIVIKNPSVTVVIE